MKKIALLLLAMATLLSCEKMSSLSNGIYLNGELISRMDGHVSGYAVETPQDITLYSFAVFDDPSGMHVQIDACKNVWGSDYLWIIIRDND